MCNKKNLVHFETVFTYILAKIVSKCEGSSPKKFSKPLGLYLKGCYVPSVWVINEFEILNILNFGKNICISWDTWRWRVLNITNVLNRSIPIYDYRRELSIVGHIILSDLRHPKFDKCDCGQMHTSLPPYFLYMVTWRKKVGTHRSVTSSAIQIGSGNLPFSRVNLLTRLVAAQ